ncbi:MAG: START-like domain-containing protein [Bacteroidales bacterium]|nr:START-like domain-containing protein [Bacteroidales bacterium]
MSKEKINIEYTLLTVSPTVLWSYISTPSGLANWFADDVKISGKKFTFIWDKTSQSAEQIGCRTGVFIRFRWDDETDNRIYFEFRILQVELTGDTILEIIDFSEPDEKDETIELWNLQIESLKRKIGL